MIAERESTVSRDTQDTFVNHLLKTKLTECLVTELFCRLESQRAFYHSIFIFYLSDFLCLFF
jgi:hypothetical protein